MKPIKAKMNTRLKVMDYQGQAPEGKRFLAWNTREDGTGGVYRPGQTIVLAGDVRLYPMWGDAVETVEEPAEQEGA